MFICLRKQIICSSSYHEKVHYLNKYILCGFVVVTPHAQRKRERERGKVIGRGVHI